MEILLIEAGTAHVWLGEETKSAMSMPVASCTFADPDQSEEYRHRTYHSPLFFPGRASKITCAALQCLPANPLTPMTQKEVGDCAQKGHVQYASAAEPARSNLQNNVV